MTLELVYKQKRTTLHRQSVEAKHHIVQKVQC